MSYFDTSDIASGYASSRPYFHPEVIQRVKSNFSLVYKYNRALDVGCGAGLSAIALTEIAESIIGVDSSDSMVRSAIKNDRVEYFNYSAENLPFDVKFDLITLAGSINWIDRPKFFVEAKRILQQRGFIVVYDNTILGIMEENDDFETWYKTEYLRKYPKPPRNESPLTPEETLEYGIEFLNSENYTNEVKFTLDSFIDYILTQSNITIALKNGTKDISSMRAWFASSLMPFFGSEEKTLRFGGYIWYLRKL